MGKKLKKHLSIDGQIAKLASRGLIIEDEDYARDVLDRISYYRLTGYLHDFREPGSDSYVDGLSFNTIVSICEFIITILAESLHLAKTTLHRQFTEEEYLIKSW